MKSFLRTNIMIFILLSYPLFPSLGNSFHLSPTKIEIGTTFNGTNLYISGKVPDQEEVVVQVLGSTEDAVFKKKGKVFGVLWMTVGHVTFKNTPNVYFVYLSNEISRWKKKKDPRWKDLMLSFSSLLTKIEISPDSKDNKKIFEDFIKLKTKERLYQMVENGVIYEKKNKDEKVFRCSIFIPPKMPVGTYTLKVLRIKNGEIHLIENEKFKVETKGFPSFISKVAFKHGLIYGILAVCFAIMAGFLMSFIFGEKGGTH